MGEGQEGKGGGGGVWLIGGRDELDFTQFLTYTRAPVLSWGAPDEGWFEARLAAAALSWSAARW